MATPEDQVQQDRAQEESLSRRAALGAAGGLVAAGFGLAAGAAGAAEDEKKDAKKPMTGVPDALEKEARKMVKELAQKLKMSDKSIKTIHVKVEVSSPEMPRKLLITTKSLTGAEHGDPYRSDPDPNDSTRCD